MAGKPPVHEIRMGLIKATVWENQSAKYGKSYTVSIIRIYKNGADWKESTRFGRDDLPLVGKVADEAHSWIFRRQQEHGSTRQNAN